MIDQCINAVFQREQRVFIPGFGAVIYSEATDRSYFNEHLTLDDGKVLEEIQRQQHMDLEESKSALSNYIQSLQETIKDKGYYFIGGIGYLAIDERGDLALSKTKEDILPEGNDLQEESSFEQEEPFNTPVPNDETGTAADIKEEETFQEPAEDLSPSYETAVEEEDTELEKFEEEKPNYNTILSEEDEGVQAYYVRKARFEKKRPAFNALWIFIPLLILGLVALYYFQIYKKDQHAGNTPSAETAEALESQSTAHDIENTVEKNEEPVEHEVSQTEEPEAASPKKEETTGKSPNNNSDRPRKNLEVKTLPVLEQHSSDPRVYSLILGSFKHEPYADRFANRLNNQGLEVSKFLGNDNFYFVGFEKIKGKDNALSLLADMRNQREPYAWITRK